MKKDKEKNETDISCCDQNIKRTLMTNSGIGNDNSSTPMLSIAFGFELEFDSG
jgi:hypothetical protein